ncbi:hypothetical protein L1987_44368 [Smallanthus sonchifolius]|uniref:Uncharacterized protein n=1 Tax=Smallanthus sonchifolius TaxID=185202 RepID=A0ACB9GPC5_9ASTR|nr:hypothetical protein L1987_44368 [Smallanthus sonchifolius]
MAIDLYSDNSGGITTSPRISFSYDLSQSDTVPVEQLLRSISSSSVDFNFCVQENSDLHHASMADELFFDGKILPTQVKSKTEAYKRSPATPPPRPKSEKSRSLPSEDEELKQQNSKSFWGFKRSSSCGNGYARSLCPITLLSRSHSTGSSTSSKRSSSSSKDVFNQKHHRNFQKPSVSQKPPLRRSGYGYANSTASTTGNGIRVNPVLNLGFGSFFSSNNKNKNKK